MSTYKELKLTILDNSNYSRWRVQVEDILTGEGVWGIVEGIQVMPPDEPEDEKKHQAHMKWVSGDGKARSILRSSIDEATFNQCRDCKTSAAILKRIQELKEPKTDNDLMSAMTDYFGLKWKDGDDANTFMSTLYVLSARIDGCGKQVKTSDDWLIAKTLACLPSQYASFVASWNLMAGAKPKMSQFREQLLLAEKMMKGQGEGSGTSGTTGESLFTRGRRDPVGAKKPVRIAGDCHNCGKPGHRAVDCWSKGKGEANNQKHKDKQGHGKGSKESMMISALHVAESSDRIIADSGATDHITNKRHWFRTLVKLDAPKIFVVGNNASIQATHIGTIDVEVSVNGKEWREVVWRDVHYAPEACDTTLLSTVTLERKGFAFSHANGKMSISRQGTAFLGGVRGEGTTYRPYMRVVVPEVLSAQSIGTWHQRLGHVSDELITTMVQNKVVDDLDGATSNGGYGPQRALLYIADISRTERNLASVQRDVKKVERVGDVVVPDGGDDVDQVVLPFPEEQDDAEEWDLGAEESEEENVVTERRGPGRPPGSKNLGKEPTPPHPMETRSKGNALNAMAIAMDPVTVEDALSREDAALWKKAMDEEMQSQEKNGTWTLEPLPAERRTVKCKWVFKSKTRPDGTLDKRKARLVACGYSQAHGIDYEETFAPVVRHESVRCVLAVAAALDLEMVQFDVKTAFLNGYLDETVFMEQPAAYEDGTNRVCRLRRSLYGLKQSPRKWNERIDAVLLQQGFKPCNEDPCVYVKQGTKEDFMILCLYVDDGLLCGVTNKILQAFLKKLQEEFELTIHKPDCYVGMEISRDREHHIISIHQEGYIKRIIQRFGLGDGKTYSSPLDSNVKLVKAEEGEEYKCPYLEAIGCLIYLSSVTRPDITYAVNRLASFAKHPSKEHWNMVKRVIRYLKGTVSLSVTYGTGRMELEGYCDSDWGGDLDERKSTSGYVFTLGGGPVAWSSQLQKLTALSAMEAEYVALAEGVKQNEWCKSFLGALGVDVSGPTAMFVDNQAAIALSKNPEIHKRSKHVAIRYHRIRQETVAGTIAVSYIPTDRNPADMLTKSVGGIKVKDTIRMLGMKD